MTEPSEIDRLLAANRAYAASFTHGDLEAPPVRRVAVLTCMDARMQVGRILGLDPGDAHVIRNAGGRVTDDAIRSLAISSVLLGTREFAVIHHTRCGLQSYTDEEIRRKVSEQTGADASDIDFLTFRDLEESVRDDVRALSESPLMPRDVTVRGFVYDVRTGELVPVDIPPGGRKSVYSDEERAV